MPDYQNGKIYSIRSHLTDDVYIGSTVQSLSNRLAGHKKGYKQWLNKKITYTSSYQIIEKDYECYIELIENYSCNNKEELHKREGEIIRATTCINKIIPGRTKKEYEKDNKEQISELKKQYHHNNKQQLNEKSKQYYNNNKEQLKQKYTCECGSTVRKDTKSRHEKSTKHQNFLTSS